MTAEERLKQMVVKTVQWQRWIACNLAEVALGFQHAKPRST
jgi:hypothetical protein